MSEMHARVAKEAVRSQQLKKKKRGRVRVDVCGCGCVYACV